MTGTLRRIDSQWYIEHTYPSMSRPIVIGVRWRVTEAKARGMSTGLLAPLADGMRFEYQTLGGWTHYGGNGNYWGLTIEKDGTVLPELPVPCPQVRKGQETRWYQGQWQKYLKSKGWVSA